MSRWLDRSDALKAHIEATVPACSPALPEDVRVAVIVDRQKEILTEVAQAVSAAYGAAVVILWTGGRNPQPENETLHLGGNYAITIRTLPVLRGENIPADELAELVAVAAHGWNPDGQPQRTKRMAVLNVELVPDQSLLVYEITARIDRL